MRTLLLSILMLSFIITKGQSHEKNTISFNLNFDGAVHGTVSESNYNGTLIDQDTSAAGTTLFRLDAQYNFLKWLSAGFFFRAGKYIEDPDNAEANGNKVSNFDLGLRAYFANKDRFTMYAGLYYGISSLEINRIYFIVPVSYDWKGNNFSADLGFNWYFANAVGLNFSLGYSGQNFNLKNYSINGQNQNLTGWTHTFLTKGVHVNLGVAIRLGGD